MDYKEIMVEWGRFLAQLKLDMISNLPSFVSALLVLAIGILFARLMKGQAARIIKKLPKMIPNEGFQTKVKQMRLDRTAKLIGNILFWMIVFFFLTAATEIIGLPVITTWLSGMVQYIPNILLAILIVFVGTIGGAIARDLVITAATTAGVTYGNVTGKLVQYAIFVLSVLIAVEKIGIDTTVLSGLIYIVLSSFLFGAALTFALGARISVSNILASYYLQRRLREGQSIRIGAFEGEIVEITHTAVILNTAEGEACIPAKEFSEMPSLIMRKPV